MGLRLRRAERETAGVCDTERKPGAWGEQCLNIMVHCKVGLVVMIASKAKNATEASFRAEDATGHV